MRWQTYLAVAVWRVPMFAGPFVLGEKKLAIRPDRAPCTRTPWCAARGGSWCFGGRCRHLVHRSFFGRKRIMWKRIGRWGRNKRRKQNRFNKFRIIGSGVKLSIYLPFFFFRGVTIILVHEIFHAMFHALCKYEYLINLFQIFILHFIFTKKENDNQENRLYRLTATVTKSK